MIFPYYELNALLSVSFHCKIAPPPPVRYIRRTPVVAISNSIDFDFDHHEIFMSVSWYVYIYIYIFITEEKEGGSYLYIRVTHGSSVLF